MQILGAIICSLVVLRLVQSIIQIRRSGSIRQEHAVRSLDLLDEHIAATRTLRIRHEQQHSHWNGYRKFRVKQKVFETDAICSFYLVPDDGKALPPFRPGQFLTFRFSLSGKKAGETIQVVRCYSLSDAPRSEQYRITVKRVPPANEKCDPGLISNYLLDHIEQGELLDVRAPRGEFAIDVDDDRPLVLIGGGIGVTPLLSMVNAVLSRQTGNDVWLFYGVRNGSDHAMKEHLQRQAAAHTSLHLSVAYSDPMPEDRVGEDFDHPGHVTCDYVRNIVKASDCDFYICGPPGMMASQVPALKEWGVSADRIHTEAFGPAAIRKQPAAPVLQECQQGESDTACMVEFARSGCRHPWTSDSGSLLDFAEQHGIPIDSGCRAGNCGSCQVAITSGNVESLSDSAAECESGNCLACVSMPDGSVSLDA